MKLRIKILSNVPLINRFERTYNRIVLGVIAAAFINGLAVLLSVFKPAAWKLGSSVVAEIRVDAGIRSLRSRGMGWPYSPLAMVHLIVAFAIPQLLRSRF